MTTATPAPAPAAGLAGAGVAAAPDTAGTDREDDDDGISVAEDLVAGPDGERTLLSFARPTRVLDRALRLTASVDFTERKLIETELSKRAYLDDLTGLPNHPDPRACRAAFDRRQQAAALCAGVSRHRQF